MTEPKPTDEKRIKKWCKHIRWNGFDAAWTILGGLFNGSDYFFVPRSWKACPICGAERPTKSNIAAAINRCAARSRR